MKYPILITLLFLKLTCEAQEKTSPQLTNQSKIELGIGGFGYSFEKKLHTNFTLDIGAGVGGAYYITEDRFRYLITPAFFAYANPKFLYNRKKRAEKGKSGSLNSGDFVGIRIKYNSRSFDSDIYSNKILLYNVHWGVQRAIGKRLSFISHIGLGYADHIGSRFDTPYPSGEFKFAYSFNR